VNVPANGSAVCTVTNNDKPARLRVTKTVVNNNSGTKTVADFKFSVDSGPDTAFPGDLTIDAGNHTVSEPSHGGYTLSFGGACNASGQVTLLPGDDKTCTLTNDDNAPGSGASGVFNNIAHPYGADDRSDPIYYVSVTHTGIADNTETIGSTPILHVAVGIKPDLQTGQAGEAPILLRFASPSGSLNQALDCDAGATFETEVRVGCQQPYAENERAGDCSNYGNNDLPPSPLDPDPANAPDCVSAKTGDVNAMRKALHDRFESPCSDNLWPANPNPTNLPPPDDPRWVTLVVTDFTAFGGTGSTNVPVTHFAGFYATGWDLATGSGSGQTEGCPDPDGAGPRKGNDPHPLGLGPNEDNGDVWGHFVTFVPFVKGGTESEDLCAFNEIGICAAVLTE